MARWPDGLADVLGRLVKPDCTGACDGGAAADRPYSSYAMHYGVAVGPVVVPAAVAVVVELAAVEVEVALEAVADPAIVAVIVPRAAVAELSAVLGSVAAAVPVAEG